MERTTVSLPHTGRFNKLVLDLADGAEAVRPFFGRPHERSSYQQQFEHRSTFPVNRELLADVLTAQYQRIGGASENVARQIERLRDENTFTVTTGHQLNIFTGPLFFIYKILHTIRLADEVNENHPDKHVVPVYWMNSEDHDLDEVGQFHLFGKPYHWNTDQTGPLGRMDPSSLVPFCDELDEVFSNNDEMQKMVDTFRHAYSSFGNLTAATRYFANVFFGDRGLVIIDSDDAQLKASFHGYFIQDIFEQQPHDLVKETSLQLEGAGYHRQVNPRQINTFYLKDGLRERIVSNDEGFKVLKTEIRFTADELRIELQDHPERFSPNVVLRPLFQEFVLPNLTYVGGGGELSYWLQYKKYFNTMGVHFPMLSIRNHFLLIDAGNGKRMDELQLLPEDLFHSVDELVKAHLLNVSDTELDFSEELEMLSELYGLLKDKAVDTDPTLVSALEAEETRQQKTIERWGSRFSRALKKQNEVAVNRIRKIHAKLFPHGYLQERHVNFMDPYSKSEGQFFSSIYEQTDPFQTDLTVLRIA